MNVLQALHMFAHLAPENPEDTLFVQLTQRELAIVAYGLGLIEMNRECLRQDSRAIRNRMADLVEVQKPGWYAEQP